ncbi:hypothetical protein UY3_07456 [Chelonia mydas]|uniref:Uncharacterized protein n=1 Tax=Chelonia mydas TaxID=8469 RepID=M7C4S0_CHEMY|nr:hypothetical protein UY3_07456 [Chelonia mydas]
MLLALTNTSQVAVELFLKLQSPASSPPPSLSVPCSCSYLFLLELATAVWQQQALGGSNPASCSVQVDFSEAQCETKGLSTLPAGLMDSDRSSGDRFIASSLDMINRPPSALPSTPVLHWSERRRQSQWGSISSRFTAVKMPRISSVGPVCLFGTYDQPTV